MSDATFSRPLSSEHLMIHLPLQRPVSDDRVAWRAYWQAHQQPWRTEPEIDQARQDVLQSHARLSANIAQGIFPFKGVQLTRADIEWLIAAQEEECRRSEGDSAQQRLPGLDLRGAALRSPDAVALNLAGLPLAYVRIGLARNEWKGRDAALLQAASCDMDGVDLFEAHLEGANLAGARLNTADLRLVHGKGADLRYAHLERANLSGAQFEGANLTGALLDHVYFTGCQLSSAKLAHARFNGATLFGAQLQGAFLVEVEAKGANFTGSQLVGADLRKANLQGASFLGANLQGADLSQANLEGAIFVGVQLEGANLTAVRLAGHERVGPSLLDVQWGATRLSVVDWSQIEMLGDEAHIAQRERAIDSMEAKGEWKKAMWANRQVSHVLHQQGLYEEAAYFAQRAETIRSHVFTAL
ncbi:pentapeptide repeat-containing protein [Ktedonobacter robiniae]|uniref:Pentapeptide repeat-containing protein n=1 Tax=Ktedonobacter robiniae TaxID=2778365 RepID=A0ABQ3V4Z1_9CHLR|nr:pentapeptide repeat-containing protein [Ktedonobacter robiniae]GHO60013.1 hypothetical protein KSB_84880 [Ktedonobacter robiniae]